VVAWFLIFLRPSGLIGSFDLTSGAKAPDFLRSTRAWRRALPVVYYRSRSGGVRTGLLASRGLTLRRQRRRTWVSASHGLAAT